MVCAEVRSILQIVVHCREFECIGEAGGIVKPIWTLSVNGIVKCAAGGAKEAVKNEDVKPYSTSFENMVPKYWPNPWKRDYMNYDVLCLWETFI